MEEEAKGTEENNSEFSLGKWEINGIANGWREVSIDKNWNGRIESNEEYEIDLINDKIGEMPLGYTIKVYFDGVLKDTFTLKGGDIIE